MGDASLIPTWLIVFAMMLFVAAGITVFVILMRGHEVSGDENDTHDYDGKP